MQTLSRTHGKSMKRSNCGIARTDFIYRFQRFDDALKSRKTRSEKIPLLEMRPFPLVRPNKVYDTKTFTYKETHFFHPSENPKIPKENSSSDNNGRRRTSSFCLFHIFYVYLLSDRFIFVCIFVAVISVR